MKDSTIISIVAIIAVAILEIFAMVVMHIDGVLLTSIVAAIAVFSGHEIGKMRVKGE